MRRVDAEDDRTGVWDGADIIRETIRRKSSPRHTGGILLKQSLEIGRPRLGLKLRHLVRSVGIRTEQLAGLSLPKLVAIADANRLLGDERQHQMFPAGPLGITAGKVVGVQTVCNNQDAPRFWFIEPVEYFRVDALGDPIMYRDIGGVGYFDRIVQSDEIGATPGDRGIN